MAGSFILYCLILPFIGHFLSPFPWCAELGAGDTGLSEAALPARRGRWTVSRATATRGRSASGPGC